MAFERGTVGRELLIATGSAIIGVVVLRTFDRWAREDEARGLVVTRSGEAAPTVYNATADLRGEGPYRRRY